VVGGVGAREDAELAAVPRSRAGGVRHKIVAAVSPSSGSSSSRTGECGAGGRYVADIVGSCSSVTSPKKKKNKSLVCGKFIGRVRDACGQTLCEQRPSAALQEAFRLDVEQLANTISGGRCRFHITREPQSHPSPKSLIGFDTRKTLTLCHYATSAEKNVSAVLYACSRAFLSNCVESSATGRWMMCPFLLLDLKFSDRR
jgi:hypothetical protein